MTSNRSVSEMVLKPCPFCGEPARLIEGHKNHWRAQCSNCGVNTGQFANMPTREAQRQATALWNTRASSQAQSDDLLRDVIEKARDSRFSAEFIGNCLRAALGGGKVALLPTAIPPAGGVEEPTDAMIEAGCEAMHKVHAAMRDRNLSDEPETMDDFDEGDVCRAVYHAMRRVAASPSAIGGGDGR